MKLLNEKYQIYEFNIGELPFKKIKEVSHCFNENEPISNISAFVNYEKDRFYLNSESIKNLEFTIKLFDAIEKVPLENKLPTYKNEFFQLIGILGEYRRNKKREAMIKEQEIPKNPNCRFIAVDDEVIQVNKIISVKKYSDTDIDIFTTGGKKASIRKTYPNRMIRDFELEKLKKLILESA